MEEEEELLNQEMLVESEIVEEGGAEDISGVGMNGREDDFIIGGEEEEGELEEELVEVQQELQSRYK